MSLRAPTAPAMPMTMPITPAISISSPITTRIGGAPAAHRGADGGLVADHRSFMVRLMRSEP
jgi:hypothetical protein